MNSALATYQHIRTAFHHESWSTAMHVLIVEAVRFQPVHQHRGTALHRNPCIRPTALAVHSGVADSQCWLPVHEDVRRPLYRRPNAGVWTTRIVMRIHWNQRLVTKSRERLHRLRVYANLQQSPTEFIRISQGFPHYG